jgi:short-subunit dehydrogenase
MQDVSGKYIWILGASSGIGASLAEELASRGAIVAVSARSKDKLQTLVKSLKGNGHIAVPLDVADPKSVKDAQNEILKTYPQIDSAIFLAAIYSPHDGKPKELSFIHDMLNVNIGGAFNMLDALMPQLEKQGHGQIVLCGSVAGYRGLPSGQPYCATKAAIINLAESLKVELEPKNIDVKVICPGFVKTPLTDKNDFPMPMMIEAETAAKAIADGLCRRSFEIHFPKRFTYIMKTLRILPNAVYFWVSRKINP